MSLSEKLVHILQRYDDLAHKMAQPDIYSSPDFQELMKEYNALGKVIEPIRLLQQLERDLALVEPLLEDPELKEIAREEAERLRPQIKAQEIQVRTALLPQDADDDRNIVMEIRAGTGGEEAALFVGDLLRMYRRFAETQGWSVELMGCHDSDHGGIREVSMNIVGRCVYESLKFEAGVHRVQRVPATEANGRLHTSTATVSVLPEAEEIDVHIDEKDLRIDVFRSSGPGGQSVNTTDSAVRITHLPSGLVVQQQDEKSQHKNKAKALKILRARLYEKIREEQESERSRLRHSQVRGAERSERIRTYNFPQGRCTDHRIQLTLYKLAQILEGDLEEIIQALSADYRAQQLAHHMTEE